MRRVFSTAIVLVATGMTGCKNQSTGTFTNPFITADRVPPPQTRVLAPGTAQPYYPGDPMPGTAAGTVPAIGAPTYGPGTPLPGGTAPLTTPPGGWGTIPPQSSVTPTSAFGDAVGVPTDSHQLRFAAAEPPAAPPAASLPTVIPAGFNTPAIPRTPIQSILPLAADPMPPQQLAQREVTQTEYVSGSTLASGASLASTSSTGDGFRPQGSTPAPTDGESDQSFRPPGIRGGAAATTSTPADTVHFAAGPNHEWIRGQLEYWPASGEWSIRYIAEGAPADSAGGRVMIDNPQVLANLSPGELVMVQGQVFGRQTDEGVVMPAYRVAAVQRQRQ